MLSSADHCAAYVRKQRTRIGDSAVSDDGVCVGNIAGLTTNNMGMTAITPGGF